ncbi:hypothetical protein ACEF39_002536 [Stenotrophomonas indicatrix]
MKIIPQKISIFVFATSVLAIVFLGYLLPRAFAPAGESPTLSPWMFNGLLAAGVIAALSAPFALRGLLSQVAKRRKDPQ